MAVLSTLLALALATPSALAHGQVRNFIASSGVWAAADAYAAANSSSPIRKLNTYGPVPDFTTGDVTCGVRSAPRGLKARLMRDAAAGRERAHERARAGQGGRDGHFRLGLLVLGPQRVRATRPPSPPRDLRLMLAAARS
jgi:hypothetical protein